jgi:hypothetical protein
MQPTGSSDPPADDGLPYTGPPPTRPYQPPPVPPWQVGPPYGQQGQPTRYGQPRYQPPPYGQQQPFGVNPQPYGQQQPFDVNPRPPYGQQPFGPNPQPPYGASAPYPPGMTTAAPYDGYPPYGVAPTVRLVPPVLGWALIAAAIVTAVGSALPWTTSFGGLFTEAGTSGDGRLTLACAVLLAAGGLLIALRQGRVWIPIVAIVLSGLVCLVALIDVVDVTDRNNSFDTVVAIGSGLWVTLVGGLLMLGVSITAMAACRSQAGRP